MQFHDLLALLREQRRLTDDQVKDLLSRQEALEKERKECDERVNDFQSTVTLQAGWRSSVIAMFVAGLARKTSKVIMLVAMSAPDQILEAVTGLLDPVVNDAISAMQFIMKEELSGKAADEERQLRTVLDQIVSAELVFAEKEASFNIYLNNVLNSTGGAS